MSLADFFHRIREYDRNAEIIFDQEEPIGRATDLVMPRRRWFRRSANLKTRESSANGRLNPVTNR